MNDDALIPFERDLISSFLPAFLGIGMPSHGDSPSLSYKLHQIAFAMLGTAMNILYALMNMRLDSGVTLTLVSFSYFHPL